MKNNEATFIPRARPAPDATGKLPCIAYIVRKHPRATPRAVRGPGGS